MTVAIWTAEVTHEMVAHLNEQEISLLLNELNDVVQQVCENYEVA